MKKIVAWIALLIFLIFPMIAVSTPAPTTVSAAEPLNVVFHYYRFDGIYTNWGLWTWPYGKDGGYVGFDTTETIDGETWVSLEFDVNSIVIADHYDWLTSKTSTGIDFPARTADQIGFIIRTSSGIKDPVGDDRFVQLSNVGDDGKVHVYMVQGNVKYAYDQDDIDLNPLGTVSFTDQLHVVVNSFVNLPLDKASYSILTDGTTDVPITNVAISLGKKATLTLERGVSINSTNVVTVAGVGTKPIDMSIFFTSDSFDELFAYSGDLGAIYSNTSTTFRVWAPTSDSVKLNLYDAGSGGVAKSTYTMVSGEKGTFEFTVSGDLHGTYYTYDVQLKTGITNLAVVDPYAKSVGINGNRGMVVDMSRTNPSGWDTIQLPQAENANDAIIYELHVRDLTSHSSWNGSDENRGKFLGLIESGTSYKETPTGFDYIKSLGITHLQILPFFDYNSVDETLVNNQIYIDKDTNGIFNWGYDPKNYNALEGSYSSNPEDGLARIQEFKQVVKGYADAGIGIIMDVVYNHMPAATASNFHKIVPNYYFRSQSYSGAGSDTASERSMFRKFMVDSTQFWASEYKLSGFRFDLMGLHDYETMNQVKTAVKSVNPNAVIIGEAWNMFNGSAGSDLTKEDMAIQSNMDEMIGIGAFNDAIRDGLRGDTFNQTSKGFLAGSFGYTHSVRFGVVGATSHPQVLVSSVMGTANPFPWSEDPSSSVNYAEAHDNATLYDKNRTTLQGQTRDVYAAMQEQAYSIILTSQGVPFMQAGVEMMRTKEIPVGFVATNDITIVSPTFKYSHNSYNLGDQVNGINWQWAVDNADVVDHYRKLIDMRKKHPVFKLNDDATIRDVVTFLTTPTSMVAYELDGTLVDDYWATTVVAHNNLATAQTLTLPTSGEWYFAFASVSDGSEELTITGSQVSVPAHGSVILYQINPDVKNPDEVDTGLFAGCASTTDGSSSGLGLLAAAFAVMAISKKVLQSPK